MNKVRNQIQQGLFILLGVFIPTSIAITNLIIGLLCLCWILEGNFKSKFVLIKSSKWMLSIFALIGLYILGLLWGDNHLNAEWQFQRLALLLLFPVLSTMEVKQETIKRAVMAFLGINFIAAILAILINYNVIQPLYELIFFMKYKWGVSAFLPYNYHNVLLFFSSSIILILLLEGKVRYRALFVVMLLVYAYSIFTELGRAGQILMIIVSLCYILFYNYKNYMRLIMILFFFITFQAAMYHTSSVYKDRVDMLSSIVVNKGMKGKGGVEDIRYVFVKESVKKILKNPILGYGTGSFGAIFHEEVKSGHIFYTHTTPHNQYLYVWFELGVLGLLLLLSIFYYQIKELFKKKDGIHRVLLSLSFMFLMLVDSYFFIFTLTVCYIFLYTIYSKYQEE